MASPDKVFSVRWNNHQNNLVSYFGNLLKREAKESFTDVTLVSKEGSKIGAHKIVLASVSPYFENVFEGHPCKHPIIILKDIQYEDLKTIITFIYHGEVNIKQEKINSILSTAASLKVKGLADVPTGDIKKSDGEHTSDSHRSHHAFASASYSSDALDDSSSLGAENIPRKKLKKSITGTGSGSNSISTNGEQSIGGGASFESGVGTSINRSVDNDGSNPVGPENRNEGVLTRVASLPPLHPAATSASSSAAATSSSHLIGKSHSLDHQLLDREAVVDSELSSGGFSENQTFDEATMGSDRAGYEIDLADVKLEEDSDGGEIEFEEDEAYGHPDNPEFHELNQSYPNIPSSSFYQPVNFASRFKGRRGRPLRPLIRQPAIKRLDEGCGGELYIEENSRNSTPETEHMDEGQDTRREDDKNLVPILTVSQSSPTPPSSPVPASSSDSVSVFQSNSLPPFNNSENSVSNNSLLMVPKVVETPIISVSSNSSNKNSSLVKQISQPSLLPSRQPQVVSQFPQVRRQNSQPNPQTRLIPLTPTASPIKRGTFFHILPADTSHKQSVETRADSPQSAIILDSNSLIQFVPSDGGRTITISPTTPTSTSTNINTIKEEKEKRDHGETSPDVTLTLKDRHDSTATQRGNHCPALRAGPALGCNHCWNSVDECGRILRRKTKYHCPECHTNLCIVPCFYEYHEKQKAEKTRRLKMQKPSSM